MESLCVMQAGRHVVSCSAVPETQSEQIVVDEVVGEYRHDLFGLSGVLIPSRPDWRDSRQRSRPMLGDSARVRVTGQTAGPVKSETTPPHA
jgi:hypothetical protein